MEILEKLFSLLEKWEEGQDEYWESRERFRKEFIEKFGFPPPDFHWCKTPELMERRRMEMRKRWKEEAKKGERDEN